MNKNIRFISLLGIIVALIILTNCDNSSPTGIVGEMTGDFTDIRDNHIYKWQKIGVQTWLSENFAYKPNTGDYWAHNNDTSSVAVYGYLYDWETAQTIAPAGWHLPSYAEWQTLVDYLGGVDIAYSKLLEAGTAHWDSPNDATNESGFTALPSGFFDQRDNSFYIRRNFTMFLSSTDHQTNSESGIVLELNQNFRKASLIGVPKMLALPIRLIKD